MTSPQTIENTQKYAQEVTEWANAYGGDLAERVNVMVGKLTLMVLRRRGTGGGITSQADPRGNGYNTLHFQIEGGKWMVITLESDPSDASKPLTFKLSESDGSKPTNEKATYVHTDTFKQIWDKTPK